MRHAGIRKARLPTKEKMPKKERLEKLRRRKPWLWSGDLNTMRQLEPEWKPLDYGKFKEKHKDEE
jgi:hypothetical protein